MNLYNCEKVKIIPGVPNSAGVMNNVLVGHFTEMAWNFMKPPNNATLHLDWQAFREKSKKIL